MNEKAETLSAKMDAPSGLDLNPRPPRSVRVSKRAAGTLMAIAAVILGLFAYGGYKRQQRQVATLAEGSMPHNVAPATAAGAEIAKDVPSGNVPNSPQQRLTAADPGILQPPGDLQSPQAGQLRRTISEWRTGFRSASTCSCAACCGPDAAGSGAISGRTPSAGRVRARTAGNRRTDHVARELWIIRLRG